VLLVGLGSTTASALRGLTARFDVCGLIRAEDDDVVTEAVKYGVPVVADATLKGLSRAIVEFSPDVVVISSFNRILSPAILSSNARFVNVHYAPLPELRGRATVNWAVILGLPETAITIHTVVAGLDAGGILYQERVPILSSDTTASLYERLNGIQEREIADAVSRRIAGDAGVEQNELAATYACARVPRDGRIDWTLSAGTICNLVRGLSPPFPPAYTFLELDRLLVHQAGVIESDMTWVGRIPGRVVSVDRATGSVDILAGSGVVRIERVSLDDRTPSGAGSSRLIDPDDLGSRSRDDAGAVSWTGGRFVTGEGRDPVLGAGREVASRPALQPQVTCEMRR